MKGTFKLENPGDAQATMTITMTIREWSDLVDVVPVSWPLCQFRNLINQLIRKSTESFYGTGGDKP